MARISKNRSFKMATGIIMTLVMIISLFAGIGAIWVSEDTDSAFAGVVNSDGIYNIPNTTITGSATVDKYGTDSNPFVVLEIVPNESMSQFGYLVEGQEPLDLQRVAVNDDASGTNATLLKNAMNLTVSANKDINVKEFDSIVTAPDWKLRYTISAGGETEEHEDGYDKFLWNTNAGQATQYGNYELVGLERPDSADKYDHVLVENITTGEKVIGYTYVKVTDPANEPIKMNKADYEAAVAAGNGTILTVGGKTLQDKSSYESLDKSKFVDATAGEGLYSTEKYEYVGNALTADGGEYSMEYKTQAGGNQKIVEEENLIVFKTKNYMEYDPYYTEYNARYSGGNSYGFTSGKYYVWFKLKNGESGPTYNVKDPAVYKSYNLYDGLGNGNRNNHLRYYNRTVSAGTSSDYDYKEDGYYDTTWEETTKGVHDSYNAANRKKESYPITKTEYETAGPEKYTEWTDATESEYNNAASNEKREQTLDNVDISVYNSAAENLRWITYKEVKKPEYDKLKSDYKTDKKPITYEDYYPNRNKKDYGYDETEISYSEYQNLGQNYRRREWNNWSWSYDYYRIEYYRKGMWQKEYHVKTRQVLKYFDYKYYIHPYVEAKYYKYTYTYTSGGNGDSWVLFEYDPSGNGDYVVGDYTENGITNYKQYAMAYDEDTAHTMEGSFGWQAVTAGTGTHVRINTPGTDTFSIPQSVGTYTRIYGSKETVKLGDYTLTEIPNSADPIFVNESTTKTVNSITKQEFYGNKNKDKYVLIPVIDGFTTTYNYEFKDKGAVLPTETGIRAYYKWKGENFAFASGLSDAEKSQYTNSFTAIGLEEAITDDQLQNDNKYKKIKGYVDNQPYQEGFLGKVSSDDLFRKYAIGLAYKDIDYTKGMDTSEYEFKGWFKDPYGVNPYTITEAKGVTENSTVYAKWLAKYPEANYSYTINFNANVGDTEDALETAGVIANSIPSSITDINRGSVICAPELIPLRKGYLFDGWYTEPACTNAFFSGNPCTNAAGLESRKIEGDNTNITLYAKWIELGSTRFTFTFMENISSLSRVKIADGSLSAAISDVALNGRYASTDEEVNFKPVSIADPVCVNNDGSESNYIFAGWYLDDKCLEKFDFVNSLDTLKAFADRGLTRITLYAKWVDKTKLPKYTVTFKSNEPSSVISGNKAKLSKASLEVEHGKQITEDGAAININDIKPELKGNIEEKISNYNVKVITVTPRDLTGENLKLIERANLIVMSEAKDTGLANLWKTYRNKELFSKKDSQYNLPDSTDTFVENDLNWQATLTILSRITGVTETTYTGNKYYTPNGTVVEKRNTIATCPVVYDYSIYKHVVDSSTNRVEANVRLNFKGTNSTVDKNKTKSYSTNAYKLFLMTQQASPVTIYNAYILSKSGSGTINNSGVISGTNLGISGDNTGNYWNEYTLVPWKVLDKTEYNTSAQRTLELIGFRNSFTLADTDKGKVSNRVFLFNNYASSNNGIVKDFRVPVVTGTSEMTDVLGSASLNATIETKDVMYYLLHSSETFENYSHNLRVLDIEPGSTSRSDSYWFWYVSRYVPNYTGTTTTNTMSTAEFICNIDDLNSQYDIIFVGTDTNVTATDGKADGNMLEFLPSGTGLAYGMPEDYKVYVGGSASLTTLKDYKLINVQPGIAIGGDYYVVNETVEENAGSKYDISAVAKEGYTRAYQRNVIYYDSYHSHAYNRKLALNDTLKNAYDFLDFNLTVNGYNGGSTAFYIEDSEAYYGGWIDPNVYIGIKDKAASTYTNILVSDQDASGTNIWKCNVVANGSSTNNWRYIRFDIEFWYKANTKYETRYRVTQKSSGTIDSPVQILVHKDTKIGKQLIYSHGGKVNTDLAKPRVGSFNTVDTNGNVLLNDDLTQTAILAGNDITFKKYKEIAEYLKAGYPIILGKGLFASTASNSIDTNIIDSASWMYKLLNELVSTSNGYYWYREDSTSQDATFLKALSNKTFRLEINERPVEYKDPLQYTTAKDSEIYINGAPYNSSDANYAAHQFDRINNKTLEFEITVDAEEPGGRYRLKMFIDTNADGRFDEETEQLDTISIEGVGSSSRPITSGQRYKISRVVEDYTGIIPWKLQVVALDSSGKETAVRDEVTGMSAIKVRERDVLYVLQITSDVSSYNSSGTNVYFPTDAEIKKAYERRNGESISKTTKDNYFTSSDLNIKTNSDTTRKNASNFYYLANQLKEFEVHFLRVSVDDKTSNGNSLTSYGKTLKQIAADPDNVIIGEVYSFNPNETDVKKRYKKSKDIKWSDINMLILGYADCYNDIEDQASLELIDDFIQGGKTTLFTHDTTSYMSYSTSTDFNAINDNKQYWGYNINKYYRVLLGMDRYGVTENHGLLTSANPAVTSISKQLEQDLDGKDFEDINIGNAKNFDLTFDVPFKPGSTMDVFNGSTPVNTNLANVEKVYRIDSSDTDTNRILNQGFINKIADNSGNNETTNVTRTNTGQIVTYPYTVGTEANDYAISVANTHTQYFQLNMEDPELVVWYSIYQKGNKYQKLANDGSNNYYIYNKGNITYSGVGHSGGLTDDEYKLFINTMIAAYAASVKATEPIVTNTDKSADTSKDYLYVDYDATIPIKKKDAEGNETEEFNEASAIPVGNGIDPHEVTVDGETFTYYTKHVKFTLRNYSIIMNKQMTVYYYPVIYSNGRKIVLYDYPLDLKTINERTGEEAKKSTTSFTYTMPDNKTSDKDNENYAVITAHSGASMVESLEEYSVDIPVTDNYYEKIAKIGNSYTYNYLYKDGEETKTGSDTITINAGTFALDRQSKFEVEIQVVMRYGRDPSRNKPLVGTRGVVFMRRGMFTLD